MTKLPELEGQCPKENVHSLVISSLSSQLPFYIFWLFIVSFTFCTAVEGALFNQQSQIKLMSNTKIWYYVLTFCVTFVAFQRNLWQGKLNFADFAIFSKRHITNHVLSDRSIWWIWDQIVKYISMHTAIVFKSWFVYLGTSVYCVPDLNTQETKSLILFPVSLILLGKP